jgi:hypothetical protein
MGRGTVERLEEEAERDGDAVLALWRGEGSKVDLAARRGGALTLLVEVSAPSAERAAVLRALSSLGYAAGEGPPGGVRASREVGREEAAREAAAIIGALRNLIPPGPLAP